MIAEIRGVMLRPRMARRFGVTPDRVEAMIAAMLERAEMVAPIGTIQVCRDPDDDVIIETAIVGKADFIVTGDQDLLADPPVLELLNIYDISVLDVQRFVRLLDWRRTEAG